MKLRQDQVAGHARGSRVDGEATLFHLRGGRSDPVFDAHIFTTDQRPEADVWRSHSAAHVAGHTLMCS